MRSLYLAGLLLTTSAWHVALGRPPQSEAASSVLYQNTQYGFCFSLPDDWKGYSILIDKWAGYATSSDRGRVAAQGPVITIRHPKWSAEDPRQDIPIMVFTVGQWRSLSRGEFFVSAAPIGPGELGRNSKYVFGLPPRFDYAFPTGYEEVEQIVMRHPLHAPCGTRAGQ